MLEDNLGDIIRKARSMSGVSIEAAAQAAGLTTPELESLEATGQSSRPPTFPSLAAALGLNSTKLQSIADGWLPRNPDLKRWQHFRMFTSAGDGMTVNAYLIWDETFRVAALFDTGFDAAQILETLRTEKLELQHIFITHSHYDHVHALGTLTAALPGAKVHSNAKAAPAGQRLAADERFDVGRLKISFRETPGHATDGVTYLINGWPEQAPIVAIVGDAIFAGSMGRGNDSWELARSKVREEILSLPGDTLLCPGHGPVTTVAQEQNHNPFF